MQDASAKLKKLKKSEIRKAILRISNFEDKQIPTQTPGKKKTLPFKFISNTNFVHSAWSGNILKAE